MAEVTVWRQDTPDGETFSDEYAQSEGFANAEAFAQNLIANSGYRASPVTLNPSFGGGTPEATGNELDAASFAAASASRSLSSKFKLNQVDLEGTFKEYFDALDSAEDSNDSRDSQAGLNKAETSGSDLD